MSGIFYCKLRLTQDSHRIKQKLYTCITGFITTELLTNVLNVFSSLQVYIKTNTFDTYMKLLLILLNYKHYFTVSKLSKSTEV